MKYQSTNTKQIYNVEFKNGVQTCPECSHLRKKKTDKCLSFNQEKNVGYCHHCNTSFFEYKPYQSNKVYVVPEWKNKTELTDKAVKYFEGRMISQSTLNKMKIYSDVEWMPQFNKDVEVICFPYFMDNVLKNIKHRGAKKSFKLVSGAELIFWNIDTVKSSNEVIITEGEIDTLTFIENGFDNCISVPNGANKNMEYLDDCIDMFKDIKIIYLATDQDTKGIELRDEFIRRFGAERCMIVSFKDCKDANEYFCEYGGIAFKELLNDAKYPAVKGLIHAHDFQSDLMDYFKDGVQEGFKIGDKEIDQFITWETKRLAVVTGLPGSGKSEFVDYITAKLNLLFGWKIGYFTPENYPLKYHYAKIYEKFIGKKFSAKTSNDVEYDMAFEHIRSNYFWILNEEDFTLDSILTTAKNLIITKGIKVLVIDPYNKIEHQYKGGISETQYISQFLDKLIMFGKLNDLLIFLVAHPRKMERSTVPNLYDISGSANFYNKTDYGITVHREQDENNLMTNEVNVYIQKVKFKNLGSQGVSELKYNYNNGRFETGSVDLWDNSNWLIKSNEDKVTHDLISDFESVNDVPF